MAGVTAYVEPGRLVAAVLDPTPALRRLTAPTRVRPADFVLPVFVKQGIAEPVAIGSMPGVGADPGRGAQGRPRRSRPASAG